MIAILKEDMLAVKDRFRAEKFAMNLTERTSTATITIGPDAPEIKVGAVLRDEDEPGAGFVWIVSKVDTDYNTNTRTLSCDHVISILKNYIIFGELKTSTLAGGGSAKTCKAKTAMANILNWYAPADFKLGDWPKRYENVTGAYSFNGDDVFSALETISTTLDDCWWEYDLTKRPFILHIRDRQQSRIETELRMSKNIQNAKVTIDKSKMFNRLFPIGKNELKLTEVNGKKQKYIEDQDSIADFGIICKTMTNGEKETESALLEWAGTQLKLNKDPAVTVTVSAMDLSQQTGEPMDHIMLGSNCRMPLPGYKTTIIERINKMSWSDKLSDPNSITVTMANTRTDVAEIISNSTKSSTKSSRVSNTNTSKAVASVVLTWKGNEYTLHTFDMAGAEKVVGTFSRAVTSWSVSATGGTITVTAKPQNQSKGVQVRGGTATQSGKTVSGPIQWYDDSAKTWKDTGVKYSATVTIDEEAIKRKVTLANPKWLYDPDPDINKTTNTVTVKTQGRNPNLEQTVKLYIIDGAWGTPATGKKYVYITHTNTQAQRRVARMTIDATLNNPVWTKEPDTSITGNSNTVTVKSATGESKFTSIYMSLGNWGAGSLTQGKRYAYVHDGNTHASTRVARILIDATMSGPNWTKAPSSDISGNSNTATITSLTGESISVPIYMTNGTWGAGSLAAGKRYVYAHYNDTTNANRIARILVDASMNDPSWTNEPSEDITGSSNTATVSAATGESRSIAIYLSRGDWGTGASTDPPYGERYVYACVGDSLAAHRVARLSVSIPNPSSLSSITRYNRYAPTGGFNFGNLSKGGLEVGYYYYMTAKQGNKTFTFYFYVQN